ncbi:MAG: hypothetical protein CMH46_00435 [Muricauda sp.]|nr:hypothetical protein [Allomuricauda sp.]MAU13990.1 hypothetical protein [Allomuricauda sp.]
MIRKNKKRKKNAAFKITPWQNARLLEKIKDAEGPTPFDFMIDEPDHRQIYINGFMYTTIRQIGKDYQKKDKTNLPVDWYDMFTKDAGRSPSIDWRVFFDELYKVAEKDSFVYLFKVNTGKVKMFSLLLTNKDVPYNHEGMMEYVNETRFKEVGYSLTMRYDVGGSIEFETETLEGDGSDSLDNKGS